MDAINKELKDQTRSAAFSIRHTAVKELAVHSSRQAIELLAGMLIDENNSVVQSAVRAIVEIGSIEAIEHMILLLKSDNARLRNLAIEVLSHIGASALPRVTELLGDFDPDIRKFAIDILKTMSTHDIQDALVRALYDDNVNVAADAAEVLGHLGLKAAVPFLIECLEKEPWLKSAAIRSLGRIGGANALKTLLKVSQKEESIILFCVVTALGDIADPKGLSYLAQIFNTSDPVLTFAAAHAVEKSLSKAGEKDIQKAKDVIKAKRLISMLQIRNTDHIRSAVRLLGFFREKSAMPAILKLYVKPKQDLFEDIEGAILNIRPDKLAPILNIIEDPKQPDDIKISLVRVLKKLNDINAYDALALCLENSREALAVEIIRTMGSLGDPRSVDILHNGLTDPAEAIRKACVVGLATFKQPGSVLPLCNMALDESDDVRMAAAKTLRQYDHVQLVEMIQNLLNMDRPESLCFGLSMIKEDNTIDFQKEICRLCSHDSDEVKKNAVKKAGNLKTKMAFESIVPLFSDKNPKVRLAGIRTLENFPKFDIEKLLLKAVGSDKDVWNRYEAVKLIGKMNLIHLKTDLTRLLENSPELIKDDIQKIIKGLNSDD